MSLQYLLAVNAITVKGIYAHCENDGGWILGHLINGTQAEYVKVPFADNSLYHAPDSLPDEAVSYAFRYFTNWL